MGSKARNGGQFSVLDKVVAIECPRTTSPGWRRAASQREDRIAPSDFLVPARNVATKEIAGSGFRSQREPSRRRGTRYERSSFTDMNRDAGSRRPYAIGYYLFSEPAVRVTHPASRYEARLRSPRRFDLMYSSPACIMCVQMPWARPFSLRNAAASAALRLLTQFSGKLQHVGQGNFRCYFLAPVLFLKVDHVCFPTE